MSNELYTVTLETPAAIIETDTRRSDVVRQRLQQLDSTVTLNEYEQADLWAEAKENSYWSGWGFPSFPDYTKTTSDLSKREIDHRIQISLVTKLLGVGLVQKAKAKTSKLKLICSLDQNAIVTESGTGKEEKMSDIMVSLINDAPNKSLKEIVEIVKRLKGETPEATEGLDDQLTWLNLPARRDAKQGIMDAIDLASKLNGTTLDIMTKEEKDISIAAALEKICADFKSDPNNQVEEFADADSDYEAADFEDEHDDSGGDDSQEESDFEDEVEDDE